MGNYEESKQQAAAVCYNLADKGYLMGTGGNVSEASWARMHTGRCTHHGSASVLRPHDIVVQESMPSTRLAV